jgi:hypothetical protein
VRCARTRLPRLAWSWLIVVIAACLTCSATRWYLRSLRKVEGRKRACRRRVRFPFGCCGVAAPACSGGASYSCFLYFFRFIKLMKAEEWAKCPHCGMPCVKEEGCFFMTCKPPVTRRHYRPVVPVWHLTYRFPSQCSKQFCYLCGCKLTEKEHYSHFPKGPYNKPCLNTGGKPPPPAAPGAVHQPRPVPVPRPHPAAVRFAPAVHIPEPAAARRRAVGKR